MIRIILNNHKDRFSFLICVFVHLTMKYDRTRVISAQLFVLFLLLWGRDIKSAFCLCFNMLCIPHCHLYD